jgi:hypothetical protein
MSSNPIDRLGALFDLSNVSPLCVSRSSWLRGTKFSRASARRADSVDDERDDETFPFEVSPTTSVYAPRARAVDEGVAERVKAAAVVKSLDGTTRVVVPEVRRGDDVEDGMRDEDATEVCEEDRHAMFEARLRRAMEAEARGVDVGRMLAAKSGVTNSPPTKREAATAAAEKEETTEECVDTLASPTAMDVNEEVVFAKEEEESPAPSESVVDDPFERMVSEAMKKLSEPERVVETPVEKQPLERAVPKREFQPKLIVKSPERYDPPARPTASTSALDFEAKLEAAMRAAEAGGDLNAILSEGSTKTMHSPIGGANVESRVNYRELGFTKAERRHHELHVKSNKEE